MEHSPVSAADLHHQVLPFWRAFREECAEAPAVVTLDFHTDTLSGLRRGLLAPPPDGWKEPELVADAVTRLHHDEHFDWALRSGILSSATIIALSPQQGPCGHSGIQVRRPAIPEVDFFLNDPERARCTADALTGDALLKPLVKEVLDWRKPWILDVDCDFFLTAGALNFPDDSCMAELIRRASRITLSRESDWVRVLRLPGETITGESLAVSLSKRCFSLKKRDGVLL